MSFVCVSHHSLLLFFAEHGLTSRGALALPLQLGNDARLLVASDVVPEQLVSLKLLAGPPQLSGRLIQHLLTRLGGREGGGREGERQKGRTLYTMFDKPLV